MSQKSSKKLYAQDGVDVEEESSFSSFAASICKASYGNSPFVEVHDLSGGHFRGPRPFTLKNLPNGYTIEASTDGIGTKGILIDAAKMHRFAANDLIAMTASDITRFGGIPLVFVNVLDIVSVGMQKNAARKTYEAVLRGLGEVAKQQGLVILKGETAQMGVSIGSEMNDSKTKINWSGVMIGAYHSDKMVTGETLAPGQVVIALKENGFRSNGISAVRAALRKKFGEAWWKNPTAQRYIKKAAVPSVLYDQYIATLHGWYNKDFKPQIAIHALAHLSGGGIKEKFVNDILFPRSLSAILDNLWNPPSIMRQCAEWRGISDEEFYEVWNGGQGMLMVIDKEEDVAHCLQMAKDFSISAQVAGIITKEKEPSVTITSKLQRGKIVTYS